MVTRDPVLAERHCPTAYCLSFCSKSSKYQMVNCNLSIVSFVSHSQVVRWQAAAEVGAKQITNVTTKISFEFNHQQPICVQSWCFGLTPCGAIIIKLMLPWGLYK